MNENGTKNRTDTELQIERVERRAGLWLGSIILLVVTPETRDKARARGWETDGVLVLDNLGHCGGVQTENQEIRRKGGARQP